VLVYCVLATPLSLARRACYRGARQPGWSWPFVFVLDSLIWLAVLVVLVCLTINFFPEVRNAVHGFPTMFHQAVDDIQNWWNQK